MTILKVLPLSRMVAYSVTSLKDWNTSGLDFFGQVPKPEYENKYEKKKM